MSLSHWREISPPTFCHLAKNMGLGNPIVALKITSFPIAYNVSIAMHVSCVFVADALHLVNKVLDNGRIARPDVRQVIWLMTDYHEIGKNNEKSSQNLAYTLKCKKTVLIFGHGEGRYHNESEKKGLLEQVSKPTKWYYDNERTIDTLPWGFAVPESKWPVTCFSEDSELVRCGLGVFENLIGLLDIGVLCFRATKTKRG